MLMIYTGCADAQQQTIQQADIPEVTVQQPQEKEQPEKRDILIAIDPGHQSWEIDMSATEPNR